MNNLADLFKKTVLKGTFLKEQELTFDVNIPLLAEGVEKSDRSSISIHLTALIVLIFVDHLIISSWSIYLLERTYPNLIHPRVVW